jgi:hypothetical protein
MTSEGLGKIMEGDFDNTCVGKIQLVWMGGQVNMSSVRRQGAKTPISGNGIYQKPMS